MDENKGSTPFRVSSTIKVKFYDKIKGENKMREPKVTENPVKVGSSKEKKKKDWFIVLIIILIGNIASIQSLPDSLQYLSISLQLTLFIYFFLR